MMSVSGILCVGCGVCEQECPVKCISIAGDVAVIDHERCILCGKCADCCPQGAVQEISNDFVMAIGTDDGRQIKSDDHVGNSRYFQIWKYSNGELNFVEDRRNPKYEEDETAEHGDPGKAKAVSGVLEGVDVLIGRRFGPNITRLKDKYVCAVTRCVTIEEANAMIKTNISDIAREYKQSSRRGIVLARA